MSSPPRGSRTDSRPSSRRAFLGTAGAVGLVALSGCTVQGFKDRKIRSRSAPAPTTDSVGDGWPARRHDARNRGRAPGPGPGSKPGVVWQYEWPNGAAWLRHEPAVVGDTVYATEYNDGHLVALDLADGTPTWHVGLSDDDWETTGPTVVSGPDRDLVLVGRHGTLYAYDRRGTQQWTTGDRLSGAVRGVTVAGDTAFVATADGRPALYAVDLADGRTRWRQETGLLEAPPAVTGGLVVAGDMDGQLVGVDRESGAEHWEAPVGAAWTKSAPLVDDTTVYVGASDPEFDAGAITAVNIVTGQREWRRRLTEVGVDSSLALGPENLYAATFAGDLLALDPDTGAERWSFSPSNPFGDDSDGDVYADNSPTVAGDHVFYTGAGNRLYAVSQSPASVAGRTRADWSVDLGDLFAPPVVAGDHLFVASERGVTCLGPSDG
ncbi:PQQ-binding-like beta-propeller repeat protein [Halobium salinum]|uniref:PQQ-binding-like beta-propeller repeat protein n=1 Tax=Halobium salinum TaxID=1364940 RepID=A0ABD5PE09_9EURY|nr:PQQ-binding-like beta-propeller repeat protein [Halobium salinum]